MLISKFWKRKLSEEYIRKHLKKLNWNEISEKGILSQSFIRQFKDQVDWTLISINQNLSKDFMFQFEQKIDIIKSLDYHKYDEKFLEDVISSCEGIIKRQVIEYICHSQNLSEKFMRKYSQLLDWDRTSKYQNENMSNQFLSDYQNQIEWSHFFNQHKENRIPKEYITKMINKTSNFYQGYKTTRS